MDKAALHPAHGASEYSFYNLTKHEIHLETSFPFRKQTEKASFSFFNGAAPRRRRRVSVGRPHVEVGQRLAQCAVVVHRLHLSVFESLPKRGQHFADFVGSESLTGVELAAAFNQLTHLNLVRRNIFDHLPVPLKQ